MHAESHCYEWYDVTVAVFVSYLGSMGNEKKEPQYRFKRDENGEVILSDDGLGLPEVEEVLVLQYFTCIEFKPIPSTLKRVGNDMFLPMNVQLSLDGTAVAGGWSRDNRGDWPEKYDELGLHDDPDSGKSRDEEFIEAVKQGRIKIEVVNLTKAEMLEKEKEWERIQHNRQFENGQGFGAVNQEFEEDTRSAYHGAEGIDFDGEAM